MESKHLVGGLGMTTTGEQVTVIVYPYRLPKRLKPLTECILETQKNFGKGAVGTVLLLCIDPKSKFELVLPQRFACGYRPAEPSAVPRNVGNHAAPVRVRASGLCRAARSGFRYRADQGFRLHCQPVSERLPQVEQGHR